MSIYAVISGPYFPVFGLNTGKYQPETTPYLDIFHAAFESFNPLLLKIANNILISIHDMLQMCLFGNLVVIFILVSSNKLPKIVRSICGSKDVAMKIC